ncbi:tetratricopeptide repeat protein [Candidatus Poribacteria bacterium]|nr:tetratricopeptide repeat protein [Candidatus Poribacteria bacterium]
MKKLSLLLLLLLINGLTSAKGEVDIPQPADLDLVEERRLLNAVETAQKAVRNSPEDAEVWGQLGHVYLSHRWEVPAIACYRQANTLAPDDFRWLYFLGRLTTLREPEKAVKYLNRALALNDTYTPAHLYLAAALRILGKLDDAQQHLKNAKDLQPDNPFSELWLAEIAFSQRQVERARAHLENALHLNPKQSEAHALMAQVATVLGDKETAKRHAQAARQPTRHSELSDPLWWDVLQAGVTAPLHVERGRRYMAEGNYIDAVAEFEVLISRTQKDIDVWLDYGVSLFHIEKYAQARAALEHVQTLLRSDKDVRKQKKPHEIAYLQAQTYNHIAQIYYETGQTDAAILTGQKAIQRFHNSIGNTQPSDKILDSADTTFLANVHANLAMAYEDIGQLEQAIAQYQKSLELIPTKSALHRDLAGVYWKMRRYTEAEPHYKRVAADEPTDVQVVYRLGLIFLTKGDYETAIARFEKVIEFDSEHVRAYEAMGIAYQEIGDISAAIDAFEKVLQLESDNEKILEMLKQLRQRK